MSTQGVAMVSLPMIAFVAASSLGLNVAIAQPSSRAAEVSALFDELQSITEQVWSIEDQTYPARFALSLGLAQGLGTTNLHKRRSARDFMIGAVPHLSARVKLTSSVRERAERNRVRLRQISAVRLRRLAASLRDQESDLQQHARDLRIGLDRAKKDLAADRAAGVSADEAPADHAQRLSYLQEVITDLEARLKTSETTIEALRDACREVDTLVTHAQTLSMENSGQTKRYAWFAETWIGYGVRIDLAKDHPPRSQPSLFGGLGIGVVVGQASLSFGGMVGESLACGPFIGIGVPLGDALKN